MPKLDLTSQERSALRSAAHPLRPVVLIGDRGLTESVLKEIDLNLKAHQLIKVRVAGDDREARIEMLDTICETLSCANVHHLGKTLIIYRPDPDAQIDLLNRDKKESGQVKRKASEPYTPKKLAAEGRTRDRRDTKPRKSGAPAADQPKSMSSPEGRPARTRLQGKAQPSRIPRRSGSALSLRAGVRRSRG
ncbi:MAG TPA: ribosome assembly RNA-binding protein YhbY [Burkholderiaceae bacterium]|nr:ribosome assembly RNA-binding protein YhbY [Burkholderiaceae bacterium]